MESKIKEVKTEIERLLTKIQEWEDAQGTSNPCLLFSHRNKMEP